MKARLALACLLLSGAAAAEALGDAVLVVKTPGTTPPLEPLRSSLEADEGVRLRSEPELRRALEEKDPTLSRIHEALGRARRSLRRFELDVTRAALAEAREGVSELAPTKEARALAVETAIREAELALVEDNSQQVLRHSMTALAIEPDLVLDRDLYSPPLVQSLGLARQRLQRASKVRLRVESAPPGARIFAGGLEYCCAPLDLELPAGWQVLWAQREGFRPALLRLQASTSGPVSLTLLPEPAEGRTRPLVQALRSSSLADEPSAARALMESLGVESAWVVEGSLAPRRYRLPARAPVAPAAVAQAPAAPSLLVRKWPTWTAAAVAVGLAVGGGIAGASARSEASRADTEPFASEGKTVWSGGVRRAQLANGLFAGAAVAASAGVVLYFTY